MMPHKSQGRGTFILDREFAEIGRLRRASGTTNPQVFAEMDAMLTGFKSQGRWDLLEALRDGRFTPLYVFGWFKRRNLDRIPTADVLAGLGASWDAWRKALDCSEEHRRSLGITRKALGIRGDHILSDTPALLSAYREQALGKASSFNKARVHVLAFLRDAQGVGSRHALYDAAAMVATLPLPKRAKRTQLSPDDVRRLCVQIGDKAGKAAWGMVATGMGPKEFWGEWTEYPDRVHIEGTKRAGRVRDVPRWTRIEKPALSFSHFRRLLNEASKVQPYDLRRAFSRWLEEAGINRVNQDAYMGHGPRTMTDLYQLGELPGQFEADAQRLRGYANEPDLVPTLRVERVG